MIAGKSIQGFKIFCQKRGLFEEEKISKKELGPIFSIKYQLQDHE
jgi:hypothetical protein